MKKAIKLYSIPLLVFVVGLGLYYVAFSWIHQDEKAVLTETLPPTSSSLASSLVAAVSSDDASVVAVSSSSEPVKTVMAVSSAVLASSAEASSVIVTAEVNSESSSVSSTPEETVAVAVVEPETTPATVASAASSSESSVPAVAAATVPSPEANAAKPEMMNCYRVVVPVLNIRNAPSVNSVVIGKYLQNDIFCEKRQQHGWVLGEIGWVFARQFAEPVSLIRPPSDAAVDIAPPTPEVLDLRPPSREENPIDNIRDFLEHSPEIAKNDPAVSIRKRDVTQEERIALLKERFAESREIRHAIEISTYYHDNGDYQQANYWAITANDMDKNSEKSWLLFAKSAYALGKKEAAVNALQTYLKTHRSEAARSLLREMQLQ